MAIDSDKPFRERKLIESEPNLVQLKPSLPFADGLRLDTSIELPKPEAFADPRIDIKGVAGKVKPQGEGELRIDADLNKLDEGIRRLQAKEASDRILTLLREAQQLIARQNFRAAVPILDKALALDSSSVYVLFLKAYCLFGLTEYDSALSFLEKASQHKPGPDERILILMLQAVCKRARAEVLEARIVALIDKGQLLQALDLTERELRNQPSNVALLFYRCGILFLLGKLPEAKQLAQDAIRHVGTDNEQLFRGLLNGIVVHESRPHLEAARLALRKGNYKEASNHLKVCRDALAGQEQFELVRSYIEERSPRSGLSRLFSRQKLIPLTASSQQKVLQWLLAEELNTSISALEKGRFHDVIMTCASADKIDARCSLIGYLHGLAIFKAVQQDLENQKPDLNRSVQRLNAASELLQRAAADPLVAKQSQSLRAIIGNYLSQLNDAKAVNELIQEFERFVQGLQQSIGSMQDLDRGESRFLDFRQRAEQLRKGRSKEQGGEVLDQIVTASDGYLRQLQSLRSEVGEDQSVAECVASFTAMMEYYKQHPIRTTKEARQALELVRSIQSRAAEARAQQRKGSRHLQTLDQLDKALENAARQLLNIR